MPMLHHHIHPSNRKTILVTGGSGYIGSHVALCCILSGLYRIVVIDNLSNSYQTAIKRISELALKALPADATTADKADCKVDFFHGDITVKEDIEKVFKAYTKNGGIFGVVHLAALKAVGESAEQPLNYYETNVTGTTYLLQTMAKYGTKRLIYSSSATVYGVTPIIPIPETSPLGPQSCYGRTKFQSESIMKDLADSDPAFRAIALRYFNPAGAHPSGEMGENPRGKPGNLLPLLAAMAVGKYLDQGGLEIFGTDYPTVDGTCVRDYIHVMDLAQAHVVSLAALDDDKLFANPAPEASFGAGGGKFKAYNIGNGHGESVFQMIAEMKKATGFDYQYKIVGRRTGDVPNLTADPALAEKELHFKAKLTLEEMCRDLWNWQKKNPNGYDEEYWMPS